MHTSAQVLAMLEIESLVQNNNLVIDYSNEGKPSLLFFLKKSAVDTTVLSPDVTCGILAVNRIVISGVSLMSRRRML